MFLDVGKEDGSDAINGIVAEPVWDWEKFDDVITDIVENRYTDYKDLKVVVVDTFDELMNLAEGEVLRIWNRDNPDKRLSSLRPLSKALMALLTKQSKSSLIACGN